MRAALEEQGGADQFIIESAGTDGWHAGSRPDRRMLAAAQVTGFTADSQ